MFLKHKRGDKVKTREQADGTPHEQYISNNKLSFPTISNYALMASCLVDTIEEKHMATYDISGAFLQMEWSDNFDNCYLRFENIIVDMFYQINPKYKDHVVHSPDGRRQYLYGKLKNDTLFYNKLSDQLEEWGSKKNLYHECIFNKIVDREQLTIQFHVDNHKISCKHKYLLNKLSLEVNKIFRIEKQISIITSLRHKYLVLTIDLPLTKNGYFQHAQIPLRYHY